jgi:hypothetical protein
MLVHLVLEADRFLADRAEAACNSGRDDCGFSALIFAAGSSAQRRHASKAYMKVAAN